MYFICAKFLTFNLKWLACHCLVNVSWWIGHTSHQLIDDAASAGFTGHLEWMRCNSSTPRGAQTGTGADWGIETRTVRTRKGHLATGDRGIDPRWRSSLGSVHRLNGDHWVARAVASADAGRRLFGGETVPHGTGPHLNGLFVGSLVARVAVGPRVPETNYFIRVGLFLRCCSLRRGRPGVTTGEVACINFGSHWQLGRNNCSRVECTRRKGSWVGGSWTVVS